MEPSGPREIFMRNIVWKNLRELLSTEEVDTITASFGRHRCCPPGVYVRLDGMDETLSLKLRQLVLGMR